MAGEDAPDASASIRALAKGGSVLFAGLVIELGISFLATLIIARVLGQVGFGAVSLGRTTMTLLSTVLLLGLDTGVGRYLPRQSDEEHRRGVLVSAAQIALPLSVVAGGVLIVAAPVLATAVFDDPSIAPVLRVFGVAVPFAALMKLAVGAVQGSQRALPKVLIRNIGQPVTRFLGIAVVLAVLTGTGRVVGVAWAYVLSYGIAAAVGVYFLARLTPLFSRVRAAPMRREMLAFSAPLALTMAMSILLSDLDTVMLGAFGTTGAVGVYNVVYPLAELLIVALSSFAFVFMPVLSELDENGARGEMRRVYQVIAKWVFVVTFPVFLLFTLFPGTVIGLTFGPSYLEGSLALSVLAVGFFVHATAGLNVNALTAIGRTRIVMYDNVLVTSLNAGLNLVLIPRYSLLGAALATTVSYLALNLLYSTQLYRSTGIQPFSAALARSGLAAVLPAGALYLLTTAVLARTTPLVLGSFAAFLLCYVVVVLRVGGIEEEEVMLVSSFEERFGIDLGPLKAAVGRLVG
jgi:O-antigen/teichoic acid export membrane protein